MNVEEGNRLAIAKRNGEIDFLRFLFALIIMLHHSRYVLGDENCLFLGGSFAVEFFFLVSGYLMMASVDRASRKSEIIEPLGTETVRYLKRKIQAFLPEWMIAWLIGFGFVLCVNQVNSPKGIYERFMDYFFELTLLRSSGLHISAINGVMWYLSAMLICMVILYPLLRKYPDMMSKVICPLVSILLLGWLMQTEGMLRNPHKWLGWTFKGNVRAMAELSLGIVAYRLTSRIRAYTLSRTAKGILTTTELVFYGLVIRYMYYRKPSEYDFFYLFLFMLAVICSFSGQGLFIGLFQNSVISFLAKYSTALFFAHLYLAQHLNDILPERTAYTTRLIIYVMLSLLNGLLVMAFSSAWRKHRNKIRSRIRKILIVNA